MQILKQKTHGFFIECGAGGGTDLSNSLFFELTRHWTGLLIEANPHFFQEILMTNRNTFAINSCLSTSKISEQVNFRPMDTGGGIDGRMETSHLKNMKKHYRRLYETKSITAQCFTLYSILKAIGQTEVDYFSLDVEGAEMDILDTIPFNKVKINVMSIEYKITGDPEKSLKKLEMIRNFFKQIGNYIEVGILPWKTDFDPLKNERDGLDVIFKRNY